MANSETTKQVIIRLSHEKVDIIKEFAKEYGYGKSYIDVIRDAIDEVMFKAALKKSTLKQK
jgi:predicted DNA-binding protein